MIKKLIEKVESKLENQGIKSSLDDGKPFAGTPKAPKK